MPYLKRVFASSAAITASYAISQVTGIDASPTGIGILVINALQNTSLAVNNQLTSNAITMLWAIGIVSGIFDLYGLIQLICKYQARWGPIIIATLGGIFGYVIILWPYNQMTWIALIIALLVWSYLSITICHDLLFPSF